MNKIILLSNFIFYIIKGELDYQISIPEFICDNSNDLTDNKNGKTVIWLSGQGKLNFKLHFERLGNSCGNNQRCNLIIWKVIRDFEKYLNTYPYTQTNAIMFNNSMLLPGLRYIFNINVKLGKAFQQKQFSLDFVDRALADSMKKKFAAVSLVRASATEAQMAYILNAKIDICSNSLDHYIEWELLDHKHNILETFPDRGSEFTIPSFTFQSGKQYFVKCNLIKMETDEILSSDLKAVDVKNNTDSLIVKLPMLYTTMKVQQPINIKPYIIDLGNHDGNIKVEWFCKFKNINLCENKYDDILNIEGGFLEEGEYNISLTVSKGSMRKSDMCIIKIMKDVPSIEIDILQYPILPSTGVHIRANVDDLRTFCTLQWKSSEHTRMFLDLNEIPGNVNELLQVVVKRDLFLRELEEFSNDVSNKEHDLIIPPSAGNWAGLPNKENNYKLQFTLEAKCPKIQLQDDVEVEYSESILNDTIMVSALVEIDVNVAPKIQNLIVEPFTGKALETVFTFQTEKAIETGTKCPFLYKFGYLLGDREYIFCNMFDNMKCETTLPYIDTGVKTFLEVCNSFNSCGKKLGPVVNILIPEQINEMNVLQLFKEKMNTEDFYKAFGYALTVLYTTKVLQEEDKYLEQFSREVFNKTQFLLKHYTDEINWAKRANKLIQYISDFNGELSFSDEVVNELVELRSKLLSDQKENLEIPRRKILAIDKTKTYLDNFKSYLEVSDIIITSSKNQNKVESEKEDIRKKIKQFMGTFCMELYQTREKVSLVFKSVILVVEELPKKLYGNFHVIPYKINPWNSTAEVKFNVEDIKKVKSEKLCIVKIIYKNILNKTGLVYEAAILNAIDSDTVLENIENTVLIPFDKDKLANKIPKCLVYTNQWQPKCKFVKFILEYAQCSCSIMGSYFLEYEDKVSSTTEPQNKSTLEELDDGHRENEKGPAKSSPSPTHKQSTIRFDTTTKSIQHLSNIPDSTLESRIHDTTNSEYITNSPTSPITERVEVASILPDFTSGSVITTSHPNIENNSPYHEEDSTGAESLITQMFPSFSTLATNSYSETNTKYSTSTVTSTTATVTEDDNSILTFSMNSTKGGIYPYYATDNEDFNKATVTLPGFNAEDISSILSTTAKYTPNYFSGVSNYRNKEIFSTRTSYAKTSDKGKVSSPYTLPTLMTKTNSNKFNKNKVSDSVGLISGEVQGNINANFSIHFSLNTTLV